MITGLAHVCFNVPDLARIVAFYRDALGLPVAFEFRRDDGSLGGVYFRLGRRTFLEFFEDAGAAPTPPAAGYRHICLEVDDIQATVGAMRARGVAVSDPTLGRDQSWQAWTADPDGHRIELHQYTDASWQTPHL